MNNSTGSTQKSTRSKDTSTKLPTPVVAILVAISAILAAFLAYKGTTMLVSSSSDPCQQGKDEVLAVKELAPDSAMLESRPDLSLRLTKAGELIYNNCQYRDGREFEMTVVEPWVGAVSSDPTTPSSSTPDSTPESSESSTSTTSGN
jgi:hypothetical protein